MSDSGTDIEEEPQYAESKDSPWDETFSDFEEKCESKREKRRPELFIQCKDSGQVCGGKI